MNSVWAVAVVIFLLVVGSWFGISRISPEQTPSTEDEESDSGSIKLSYVGENGSRITYLLFPPAPTTDGWGVLRSAYRLESLELGTGGQPWLVEWIDGRYGFVKTMVPCTWDHARKDPCGASEFYWSGVGNDKGRAKSAATAVNRAGIFALQQDDLHTELADAKIEKTKKGATILEAENRAGNARFTYKSSQYWPDLYEIEVEGEWMKYVLEEPDFPNPVPGAEVWPVKDSREFPRTTDLLYPDADKDFLGTSTTVQGHYEALRNDSGASNILENGGCVASALHFIASDADEGLIKGLLTNQITATRFKLADQHGNRTEWMVRSSNGTASETEPTVIREDDLDSVSPETCPQQNLELWTSIPVFELHRWITRFAELSPSDIAPGYTFVQERESNAWFEMITFSLAPQDEDSGGGVTVSRKYVVNFDLSEHGQLHHVYIDRANAEAFLDQGFVFPAK